ncbi:hypothetical protein K2173_005703 [Erythroxylum novogranatense]|uniref:Germin-like protein n=1 Tax=Erythroxylum novogranatense TaxID=1862640 RepID=A0AAV8SQI9_9ROSI|nr:hypothetical protein K2173_005703 [Erythroxylum novogranatense]
MAINHSRPDLLLLPCLVALFTIETVIARDPDVLTDFRVAPNTSVVNGNYFTYSGLRGSLTAPLIFPNFTYKPLVFHTQTLQRGDIFVFPKGLVHYQNNPSVVGANAISAFGSASARTVSVHLSIFTSGIDDGILAKAFKTDVYTIQKIKGGFPAKI